MDAGVVEQVSLGKEIEGEINRIFSLPVTEGRAIVRAAEVFGVDASTTSFQDLGQLKDVIFEKAAAIWKSVANKPVNELTREDLRTLEEATGKLQALKEINGAATSLSTEDRLRAEHRIQDDPKILAQLGYKGERPQIPAELLEECARTSGTVVLRFKTTVADFQSNLNGALGPDKQNLHLYVNDRANNLAITNDKPEWINVPNTVKDDTLGLSKTKALKHVPGSATCDPMDTVLMLGYNNLETGQQMPGFKNKWTFTDQKNMLVGSHVYGFIIDVRDLYDDDAYPDVGLAPRFAPESKN